MIKTLSVCCCAEIGKAQQMEFPLGGYRGIAYTINVCTDCGNEADLMELYCCDLCGEVSDHKMMVNPEGDDMCDCCIKAALRNVMQLADKVIANYQEEIELTRELLEVNLKIKRLFEEASA